MFNLIPREVRFFDLFDKQSEHIIKAAALLYELVHNFADARAKTHLIKEIEHQGDQVTHEIVKRLNTTFITPIDREDVHDLATMAVVTPAPEDDVTSAAREALAAAVDVRGGVGRLPRRGILIRCLAETAPALGDGVRAVWEAVRAAAFGAAPIDLRKY